MSREVVMTRSGGRINFQSYDGPRVPKGDVSLVQSENSLSRSCASCIKHPICHPGYTTNLWLGSTESARFRGLMTTDSDCIIPKTSDGSLVVKLNPEDPPRPGVLIQLLDLN